MIKILSNSLNYNKEIEPYCMIKHLLHLVTMIMVVKFNNNKHQLKNIEKVYTSNIFGLINSDNELICWGNSFIYRQYYIQIIGIYAPNF